MIYWFIIIIGIVLLSISISNPVYKIVIKKYLKINLIFEIILRLIIFTFSIILIFIGLFFINLGLDEVCNPRLRKAN